VNDVVIKMHALKSIGVRLPLDDFGKELPDVLPVFRRILFVFIYEKYQYQTV
jgi:hypothetical protein